MQLFAVQINDEMWEVLDSDVRGSNDIVEVAVRSNDVLCEDRHICFSMKIEYTKFRMNSSQMHVRDFDVHREVVHKVLLLIVYPEWWLVSDFYTIQAEQKKINYWEDNNNELAYGDFQFLHRFC